MEERRRLELLVAGFMVEGFVAEAADEEELSRTYELTGLAGGAKNTIAELLGYAPTMADRYFTLKPLHGPLHGVFEYECASMFGVWFYAELWRTGAIPETAKAEAEVLDLVDKYFAEQEGRRA